MKVKIDLEKIYSSFQPAKRFEAFLQENKDTVFTAVEFARNSNPKVGAVFYCLAEDPSDPPWILNGIYLKQVDEE